MKTKEIKRKAYDNGFEGDIFNVEKSGGEEVIHTSDDGIVIECEDGAVELYITEGFSYGGVSTKKYYEYIDFANSLIE